MNRVDGEERKNSGSNKKTKLKGSNLVVDGALWFCTLLMQLLLVLNY